MSKSIVEPLRMPTHSKSITKLNEIIVALELGENMSDKQIIEALREVRRDIEGCKEQPFKVRY